MIFEKFDAIDLAGNERSGVADQEEKSILSAGGGMTLHPNKYLDSQKPKRLADAGMGLMIKGE